MHPFETEVGKVHEHAYVEASILKSKRDRYKNLLGSIRRRKDILCRLRGPNDILFDSVKSLDRDMSDPDLTAMLFGLGSPKVVYAFSDLEFPMGHWGALDETCAILFSGSGGVISCLAGKLIAIFGEDGMSRYYYAER